ncbi:MAG: AbrB/MazE/SpoVT family DNA-binding domain-containing protein [Bacilli bacterium]|nr:AbrB/MazE/SpoVT family DNA-binding domain-containing protein [Bacilli bacterium]
MNQTGIIRKIDDLGRIVLPKELRKHLNINSGDDFQILLDGERIILEKYSYLKKYNKELLKIIDCFNEIKNYDINLIINNKIINKDNIVINNKYIDIIKERKIYINDLVSKIEISKNIIKEGKLVIYPIVINSDLLGSILIISNDKIENVLNYAKVINNLIKNYYI